MKFDITSNIQYYTILAVLNLAILIELICAFTKF